MEEQVDLRRIEMLEWTPRPGTLPGRTEMYCLRAMLSLERAGADPVPLGAVYGFATEMKHPTVKDYDRRWQISEWMRERGWKIDYDAGDVHTPIEERTFKRGRHRCTWEQAYEGAATTGFAPFWNPSESTIRKRLVDMEVRGQVEKVGPARWRMTDEGRHLAKRVELWVS